MRRTVYIVLSAFSFVVSLVLTACGGSGGGSTTAPVTPNPGNTPTAVTYNTGFTQPVINDNYTGAFRGNGRGLGGDSGGSASSGGGAGDGEFIQLTGGLPAGTATTTLTWKVLRSQYGQQDSTGTLTVQVDTNTKGGYMVTAVNGNANAVRATQSNIFVSTTGIVTGTLPLNIGGAVRDTAFTALRFKDATASTTDFSAMAGTYGYGYFTADTGTGANRYADGGWMRVNADGTGRMCDGAVGYSATCANGLDFVSSYDTVNKSIVHVTQAAVQSQPVSASRYDRLDALLVAKPVAINGVTGYTFSGDVLSWDSRNVALPVRTGIAYASRAYDAATPTPGNVVNLSDANIIGSYNIAMNSVDAAQSGYFYASFARVGTVVKGRGSAGNTVANRLTCGINQLVFPAASSNGVLAGAGSNGAFTAFFIYTDVDSFVYIPNDNSGLGVARRMNTDPTITPLANCQPV
jgi:hypothetical protein